MAMIASVIIFHLRITAGIPNWTEWVDLVILLPYLVLVLITAICGALFANWYAVESGLFEMLVVPLMIGVLSIYSTALLISVASLIIAPNPSNEFAVAVWGAMMISTSFIYVAWPALLSGLLIASWYLSRRFR